MRTVPTPIAPADEARAAAPRWNRRPLLAAAGLGAAALAVGMPAMARADEVFSPEFLTAPEDLSGFDPAAPTEAQIANARLITAVGRGHGVPEQGIQVALATAIVESWLYNRNVVTDADSGGLFQQRPRMDWGSAEQVRDKNLAAKAFYGVADHTPNPGLLQISGWEGMSIGAAAQAVQRSAYPGRYDENAQAAYDLLVGHCGDVTGFVA